MSYLKKFLYSECKSCNDVGLLILRLTLGLVLLYGHGFGKLTVIFSGQEIQFMDPIGIGAHLSFIWLLLPRGFVQYYSC